MTVTGPLASRDDWHEALNQWYDSDPFELHSWVEYDDPHRGALVSALAAASDTTADGDIDIIRACLAAAEQRHGPSWTVADFATVIESFIVCLPGGWAELAQDYIDDHYPGLPGSWLNDLTAIGKDVKKDSERYVTLDNSDALYVFTRPA